MSDTQPDTGTTDAPADTEAPADQPDTGDDLSKELEKWKAQARKHEERAKANANAAKELEQLRQATMSDTEKAVEVARQQARAEAFAELGGELVGQAVRAAVAGRGVDADAILEGLDRSRFIADDGRPDLDAIASWVDRIVPKPADNGGLSFPDLGQGARSNVPLGGDALEQLLRKTVSGTR